MNTERLIFALTATALLLLAGGSPGKLHADDGMRCGQQLIRVGDYITEVLDTCGEPDFREGYSTKNSHNHCNVEEQWMYDRGYGQFNAILTFRDGRLASIEMRSRN